MTLPAHRAALLMVAALATSHLAHATDWYVDASATAPGDGSLAQPFPRIDAALAANTTLSGDRIFVAPGDYVDESIDFLGKEVRVVATGGPAVTVVRGLGPGTTQRPLVQAVQGEGSSALLSGFTLREAPGAAQGIAAAIVLRGSSLRIEHCRFEDNVAPGLGSAIYADGGAPLLSQCTFVNNGGDAAVYAVISDLEVRASSFEASAATTWGGIWVEQGRLTLRDTQFAPNGSGTGHPEAAMHLLARQSTVEILQCQWDGAVPSSTGGRGVYLNNCFATVENSVWQGYRTAGESGSALLGFNGDVVLTGCTFQDCSTATGFGGAVALVGCRASFVQCQLLNNEAGSQGGSIYKWGFENLFLVNSYWQENRARAGGAVFVAFGPLYVQGSSFLDNEAFSSEGAEPSLGGAIASLEAAQIEQTWFANNAAGSGLHGLAQSAKGGALYTSGFAELQECLFEDNQVLAEDSALGGAAASDGTGVFTRCVAKRNTAEATAAQGLGAGGGLWGALQVKHGTLAYNTASHGGGGAVDVHLDHSIVYGNTPDDLDGQGSATYSVVPTGYPGSANLYGDPRFWGPNDLHLMPGSIAIDAGDPNLPTDPDGTPRDLGALLFDALHCGPGCTGEISTPVCQSRPNSTGQNGGLRMLGSATVADNLVILLSDRLPFGLPGYYLIATDEGYVPFFGGSQGNLCLGGALYRLNQQVQLVNAAGKVSRTLDLNLLPALGAQVLPGQTWHFQFWHRDFIGVQSTSNTTDSASVLFQ